GAGVAIAVATDLAGAVESSTDFSQLCIEFSCGCHHVGEPPSFDPRRAGRYSASALVELESAFLDVTGSICDGVSRQELSPADGRGLVRSGFVTVWSRVFSTA